jgi:hypothetical protein
MRSNSALLEDGSLTCWGSSDRRDPTPIIDDGVALLCNENACCVLREPQRHLTCWAQVPSQTWFPPVADVPNIRAFGLTTTGGCMIFHNRSISCWVRLRRPFKELTFDDEWILSISLSEIGTINVKIAFHSRTTEPPHLMCPFAHLLSTPLSK